jgi:hypothetical protein
MVAWAMRYILSRELWFLSSSSQPNRSGIDVVALNLAQGVTNNRPRKDSSSIAVELPSPISPVAAREADGDAFCAEGAWFKDHVVKSSVTTGGWQWVDDTTSANLQYCNHFNCHKLGYTADGAGKSLDILVSNNEWFFYL